MLIKLYEKSPDQRKIQQVCEVLEQGGLIIYPTDTVYGLGCDITNQKAIAKIAQIKGIQADKSNFSFICHDLSHISDYTKPIHNNVFKLLKQYLPGPYTFILPANSNVPKLLKSKKKTVGIRIPDNNIIQEIVKNFGRPILTTSLLDDDEILEYQTDPELINEKYDNLVDIVIDGGFGGNIPSTVLKIEEDGTIEILRQGKGEIV